MRSADSLMLGGDDTSYTPKPTTIAARPRPKMGAPIPAPGFVPPPPAVLIGGPAPVPAEMMAQGMPQQIGMGQAPAQPQMVPTAMVQEGAVSPNMLLAPPNFDLVKQLMTAGQPIKDEASRAEAALKDFKPSVMPTQFQQSPMEQMMSQAYGDRIQELLGKRTSMADRFDAGYARGSKIASNILGPLIAGFAGGDGRSLMDTVHKISTEGDQVLASQKAKREQDNMMLMHLSNAYEQMDPNSAKNIMALAKERLAQAREDRMIYNQLQSNHMAAQGHLLQHQKDIVNLSRGLSKDQNALLFSMANEARADAGLDNTLKNGDLNRQESVERMGLAKKADKRADASAELAQHADARGNSAELRNQREEQRRIAKDEDAKTARTDQFSFAKDKEQTDARQWLTNYVANTTKTAGARNMMGQLKDPNFMDNLRKSPGNRQLVEQMMTKAGVQGKMEDLFGAPAAKPAEQNTEGDFLGDAAKALGLAPQAAPKSAGDAVHQFYVQNGHVPTKEELKNFLGRK